MAINLPILQPLSFQQNNPALSGMQAGNDIIAQQLANRYNQIRNQYAGPQAQQTLLQAQLANQASQAKLPYVGPSAQQSLLQQQLGNQVTQAQLPYAGPQAAANLGLTQAQGGLTGANTGLAQANTAMVNATLPYAQYKFVGPYAANMAKLQNSRLQQLSLQIRASQTPAGQARIATDAQYAASVKAAQDELANATLNNNMTINNGFPGSPGQMNLQTNPVQGNASQSSNVQTSSPGSMQTTLQPMNPAAQNPGIPNAINQQINQMENSNLTSNPQVLQTLQQSAANQTAKNNYNPAQMQTIQYANIMSDLLKQGAPLMQSAAKFAGAAGFANKTANQIAQTFGGEGSPEYQQYELFKSQVAIPTANEYARVLGKHATDMQTKLIHEIADPVAWDKSPAQVMKDFNMLVSNVNDYQKQLNQTPAQSLQQLQQNIANPTYPPQNQTIPIMRISDGQIAHIPVSRLNAALATGRYRRANG